MYLSSPVSLSSGEFGVAQTFLLDTGYNIQTALEALVLLNNETDNVKEAVFSLVGPANTRHLFAFSGFVKLGAEYVSYCVKVSIFQFPLIHFRKRLLNGVA